MPSLPRHDHAWRYHDFNYVWMFYECEGVMATAEMSSCEAGSGFLGRLSAAEPRGQGACGAADSGVCLENSTSVPDQRSPGFPTLGISPVRAIKIKVPFRYFDQPATPLRPAARSPVAPLPRVRLQVRIQSAPSPLGVAFALGSSPTLGRRACLSPSPRHRRPAPSIAPGLARRILGSEPVLPSRQAPRRRHAEAVRDIRKNLLKSRKSVQATGE
jgi:hypothetical protein